MTGSTPSLPVAGRAPRVLVIYKTSTLDRYRRGRRNGRVEQLLADGDPEMERVVEAHDEHRATVEEARRVLKRLGARATVRNRWSESDGSADGYDLVVTLGGDGTLLFTSHIVGPQTPMLAINSAPKSSVGYFCASDGSQLEATLDQALAGKLDSTELTRMQVEIDGKAVSTRVLNDALFCHESPAVTSRYTIEHRGREEEQRSSGVWVGPAAGSTAAIRSAGGQVLPLESKQIQFVVRELYRPVGIGPSLEIEKGFIEPGEPLLCRSMMRGARVFMDGAHSAEVDFGSELRISASTESLTLLGLHPRVRQRH